MSRAGSSIVINRPIAEVFAYVADQARTTSWCLGMTECRLTSDTGMTVGATRRVEVKVPLMGSASWDFELVECVHNVRMVWNDQDAVIPLRDTYGFEEEGHATRFSHYNDYGRLPLLFRLIKPLFLAKANRTIRHDNAALKRILEGGGAMRVKPSRQARDR